jgi:hypothetical protein
MKSQYSGFAECVSGPAARVGTNFSSLKRDFSSSWIFFSKKKLAVDLWREPRVVALALS